jgi:hypothetical protein
MTERTSFEEWCNRSRNHLYRSISDLIDEAYEYGFRAGFELGTDPPEWLQGKGWPKKGDVT